MRNKANLKDRKLNTTHYGTGGYDDFSPKTKNGTKPIKANLKPISKPHFSAELLSDTRLRQGPPAGVQVYVEDWTAAVQRSSRKKKPLKSPRGAKIKNTKSKPNFGNHQFTSTTYNNSSLKPAEKANPIQTQCKPKANPISQSFYCHLPTVLLSQTKGPQPDQNPICPKTRLTGL